MTQRCLQFGLITFLYCLATGAAHSAQDPRLRDIYFLGATPTPVGPNAYPASLYEVDQTTHKLRALKDVISSRDGVAFVKSAPGTLVLGTPHISPNHLTVLPFTKDNVEMNSVGLPNPVFFRDSAVAIRGHRAVEMFGASRATKVSKAINIELTPQSGVPHVIKGGAGALSNLEIEGETGGPYGNWDGLLTELASDGNIKNQLWSALPGIIAPGPQYLAPLQKPVLISVLCSNSYFLVVMVSRTHNEVESASEIRYFVFSEAAKKWIRLTSPGGQTRLRILGHWLVSLIVEGKPGGSIRPVQALDSGDDVPDIDRMYADLDPPVVFTGRQIIMDLNDDSSTDFSTGNADSEVLSISGHWLWFRVRSTIFLARLAQRAIVDKTLVVDDVRARQIHWALQR